MVDHMLHSAHAFIVLTPALYGHFWASALFLGVIRELEQMKAAHDWTFGPSRALDVAGYLAAGIILQAAWSWGTGR